MRSLWMKMLVLQQWHGLFGSGVGKASLLIGFLLESFCGIPESIPNLSTVWFIQKKDGQKQVIDEEIRKELQRKWDKSGYKG